MITQLVRAHVIDYDSNSLVLMKVNVSIVGLFLQIERRQAGKKFFDVRFHVAAVVVVVADCVVVQRQPLGEGFHQFGFVVLSRLFQVRLQHLDHLNSPNAKPSKE